MQTTPKEASVQNEEYGYRTRRAATYRKPKMVRPSVPLTERTNSRLVRELFLEALRVTSPTLNTLATEVIRRIGASLVHDLMTAALNKKNGPAHRVRLLRTIGSISFNPSTGLMYDVILLFADRNGNVRAAAAELLENLRERSDETTAAPGGFFSGCGTDLQPMDQA